MPTYQYACTSCGERLEAVQKFSDDPLTVCPACSGPLRKVFSPVGVVFKGSGFYKTDSRSSSSRSSTGAGTSTTSAGDTAASTGSSEPAAGSTSSPASGDTGSTGTPSSAGGSGSSGDRVA